MSKLLDKRDEKNENMKIRVHTSRGCDENRRIKQLMHKNFQQKENFIRLYQKTDWILMNFGLLILR